MLHPRQALKRSAGAARMLLPVLLALSASGCSLFSVAPTWELFKVAGQAGNTALAYGSAAARNTVHHGDAPVDSVCIEFNRDAQAADLVPALQAELRMLQVQSRVYESGAAPYLCKYWLRYVASIQWEQPPLSSSYRPYVSAMSLSLHRSNGELMSSSSYDLDSQLGISKWASTRAKLAPVVKALITGFEG